MVEEPEGPEAVQRATDACLRLLAVRARSRHELTLALERKGYASPVREAVMARLEQWGYLDDAKFARERAASLLGKGKLGPRAVLQRLQAHGLEGAVARQALASAKDAVGFDALAAARQVLERRRLAGRPLDAKEQARAGRLLLSRGFAPDVVTQLVGEPSLDPSGQDE
ncbi:regulatory protein RecX [Corallococcus sicarius]|uniref:Regulatory protein RecX n=1 Tax=Corallococcus sicarius TaxID=2316726 RepID=A0A3A8N611_9BACT|nr:regulatory protein RecX [Corallococcus sicarius]RKH37691.1 regulatory protein RecX [Corallococcus sicarius]